MHHQTRRVFYVANGPNATRAWYRITLGIDGPYGPQLASVEEPRQHPYSHVSPFADDE